MPIIDMWPSGGGNAAGGGALGEGSSGAPMARPTIVGSRVTILWPLLGRVLVGVGDLPQCPIVIAVHPSWYYYDGPTHMVTYSPTSLDREACLARLKEARATAKQSSLSDEGRLGLPVPDECLLGLPMPSARRVQRLLGEGARELLHTTGAAAICAIDGAEAAACAAGTANAIVVHVATYIATRGDHESFQTATYVSYVQAGRLAGPPTAYFGSTCTADVVESDTKTAWHCNGLRRATVLDPAKHVPLSRLVRDHPALSMKKDSTAGEPVASSNDALYESGMRHFPWARFAPIVVVDASAGSIPRRWLPEATADTDATDFSQICVLPPCPPVYLDLLEEQAAFASEERATRGTVPRQGRAVLFDQFAVERGALIAATAHPDFRSSLLFDEEVDARRNI